MINNGQKIKCPQKWVIKIGSATIYDGGGLAWLEGWKKKINFKNKYMSIETFETLWDYCTSNNRLCPMPMKWNDLFGMLKDTQQNSDGSWTPSLPLILSGWEHTIPLQKFLVFQEHIKWATDKNQIEEVGKYLRSLSEDEWAHYGEI